MKMLAISLLCQIHFLYSYCWLMSAWYCFVYFNKLNANTKSEKWTNIYIIYQIICKSSFCNKQTCVNVKKMYLHFSIETSNIHRCFWWTEIKYSADWTNYDKSANWPNVNDKNGRTSWLRILGIHDRLSDKTIGGRCVDHWPLH